MTDQIDDFRLYQTGLSSPARRHFTINPSDSDLLTYRVRAIYCLSAGDAVVVDEFGTEITYTLAQGDLVPLMAVQIKDTGTTATLVGWA